MQKSEKERRVSHITDTLLREKVLRVLDIVQQVLYTHEVKHSDFLTPYEQRELASVLNGIYDVRYSFDGMSEQSERKIVSIYPDYLEESCQDILVCLKITGNTLFSKLSHRDYLGSILGLGLRREKIGDIFVVQDGAYLICLESIADYIRFHLEKVKNVSVKVNRVEKDEIELPKQEKRECEFVVSSIRLDSIVAGMFHLSRNDAKSLVQKELVSVDYEVISNPSKILEPPSVISVRGFGKGTFEEVLYQTKKDRYKLRATILK